MSDVGHLADKIRDDANFNYLMLQAMKCTMQARQAALFIADRPGDPEAARSYLAAKRLMREAIGKIEDFVDIPY